METKVIPASILTTRLHKVRSRIENLTQQAEDLRKEEKFLVSLLHDAVDGDAKPPAVASVASTAEKGRPERTRGVVDAILKAVMDLPGITRDQLVEELRHLNLNPFDPNTARRVILNNLGNQIRSGKIKEEDGGFHLVEPE